MHGKLLPVLLHDNGFMLMTTSDAELVEVMLQCHVYHATSVADISPPLKLNYPTYVSEYDGSEPSYFLQWR
jgi:hypothetical protein